MRVPARPPTRPLPSPRGHDPAPRARRAAPPVAWVLGLAAGLAVPAIAGPGLATAHEVRTKAGKVLEGTVVSQDGDVVVIETTFDGRKEVPKADVASVDTSTPPLREQLAFRLDGAKDLPALLAVLDWAKARGFKAELLDVWRKVLTVDPANVKAHKALGHVLVDKRWMTPEEKAAADAAAQEAAMRAKGLVLHGGRWVTPQEKEALEKGLMKDGDEWVTEEVFHARRGEKKVDGAWVRVGEAEGKARAAALSKALEAPMVALWGPHVDVIHELGPDEAAAVLDAAEKVAVGFERLMRTVPEDKLEGLRVSVVVPHKAPTYARYVREFARENEIEKMKGLETWATSSSKMKSFWWTDPQAAIGAFLFPNTLQVLKSTVAHSMTYVLLNRYRFNFRFSTPWLTEGLAYHLEIAGVGPSSAFTIGRAGIPGGGDPTAWQDTTRWPELLRGAVLSGQDTPLPRLVLEKADGLSLVDLAKAWSVVDYLVRLDPVKFKAFVDGTKAHRDDPEEGALKAAYGFDFRTLETRWRAAVGEPPAPAPAPGPTKPAPGPTKPAPGGKKGP